MADEKQPESTDATDAVETAEAPRGFQHHVSHRQYVEGLKAEFKNATDQKHKAAIKAELDTVNELERAVQTAKEQA